MAYTKLGWVNDRTPALNQTNLNHMDQGIYDAHHELSQYEDIFTGDVGESVQNWLDEHPEATTTVLDNSITSKKFNGESVPFYNVVDYGILPDHGDVYSDLYDFLADYVYDTGGVVYFPKGRYTISYTICIPENTTFIGDGADTEIYFDETDTTFGTGLTNAGSNVAIKNMKVSQNTRGIFHSGAQPGCIGFSDNAKEQAIAGKYAHTFARAEVQNLLVENVYFEGVYPLQTENDSQYSIHNVIYRNLSCPDGCVSVMASSAGIDEVLIENVNCGLFRISVNADAGKVVNVMANNITCKRFSIMNEAVTDSTVIINNMKQTSSQRIDDAFSTDASGEINSNVEFNNCVFNTLPAGEVNGINLYSGIRTFKGCVFNSYRKIITRQRALSNVTNIDIFEDCTFNVSDTTASNILVFGYGRNNTVNADNINFYVWGDAHLKKEGVLVSPADVTGQHKTYAFVDGDKITLSSYQIISNTNSLMTLKPAFAALPLITENIPVVIFNGSTRTTNILTFAKIENGVLKVAEPGLDTSTAYNRVLVEAPIHLSRRPTPTELANFLI